jgi:hypothetical protein
MTLHEACGVVVHNGVTRGTGTVKEVAVETPWAALSLTANIHKLLLRRSKRRPDSRVVAKP